MIQYTLLCQKHDNIMSLPWQYHVIIVTISCHYHELPCQYHDKMSLPSQQCTIPYTHWLAYRPTIHNDHYYIIYFTIPTIYSSCLPSLFHLPSHLPTIPTYIRREPVQRHLPKTVRVCRAAPSCCACAPQERPWSCWTQWPAWTEGPQQCGRRARQTAWWRRGKMSAASWQSLEVHLKKGQKRRKRVQKGHK